MSRKNFHDLLTRYLKGNCSTEEKETVELWYKMLDDDSVGFRAEDLSAVENRLWLKIGGRLNEMEDMQKPIANPSSFFTDKRSMLAWAAVLAGFVIAAGLLFFTSKPISPNFKLASLNGKIISSVNKSGKPVAVHLQDGSFVVLQPGAALTYPERFAPKKREVFLRGEAYFLISKNPERPFLVYNHNTITRVVGTSFIVKTSDRTAKTEVSVKTGRVVVIENVGKNMLSYLFEKPAEVVLTPNFKTTFNASQKNFKTTLVSAPIPVLKPNEILNKAGFVFNETTVAQVLKMLSSIYGIEIIGTKEVNESTFTGDISDMGLYGKLDMICQSIHADYKIEGTKILIK